MPDADLVDFERLIEAPDRDLYLLITGEADTPSNDETPVFRRLKAFHTHTAPIHS